MCREERSKNTSGGLVKFSEIWLSGWDAEGRYREAKEGWIILICKLSLVI